jgi:transcriptional regulator
MYAPLHFRMEDEAEITGLIAAHPFATLVAGGAQGPIAGYAPMLLEADGERRALVGHLARANPFGAEIQDGAPVLAIFRGPDAYVRPGYYPSKSEHGRVVPTWNYVAVEATGKIRFTRERGALIELVSKLTQFLEGPREKPWAVSDAPAAYIERLASAIVGFSIDVETLSGKAKLSQNHRENDRNGVLAGLSHSADPGALTLAAEMQRLNIATLKAS